MISMKIKGVVRIGMFIILAIFIISLVLMFTSSKASSNRRDFSLILVSNNVDFSGACTEYRLDFSSFDFNSADSFGFIGLVKTLNVSRIKEVHGNLKNIRIELMINETYNVSVPVYGELFSNITCRYENETTNQTIYGSWELVNGSEYSCSLLNITMNCLEVYSVNFTNDTCLYNYTGVVGYRDEERWRWNYVTLLERSKKGGERVKNLGSIGGKIFEQVRNSKYLGFRICGNYSLERTEKGWSVSIDHIPYFNGIEYTEFAWWNASWLYRRPVTINNTQNTNTLTDYQVLVTLDTASLITEGKMRDDCGDIRFVDSDGTTLLNYWIESGCNSTDTKIWVKVPEIPASSRKIIYVYYGNPNATSMSNGTTTFDFFDDFTTLDTNVWVSRQLTYSLSDKGIILDVGAIVTQNFVGSFPETIAEAKITWLGASTATWGGFAATGDPDGFNNADATHQAGYGPYVVILPGSSGGYFRFAADDGATANYIEGAEWHILNIPFIESLYTNASGNYWYRNYEFVASLSLPWTGNYYILFGEDDLDGTANYPNFEVDFVRVRKYTSPEPTTSVPIITIYSPLNQTYDFPYNFEFKFKVESSEPTFEVKAFLDDEVIYHDTNYQSSTVITLYRNLTYKTYNFTVLANISNDIVTKTVIFTIRLLKYRRPVTIDNTQNNNTLTDYQVLVTLDTASLITEGKMRDDCGDIRFVDSDDTTLLNYWIESGCNSTDTKIWVKVPEIPASSTKTIYVYYGNSEATSLSSETAIFILGEVEALTTYTKTSWGTGSSYPEDTYNTKYHDARNEIIYTFTDFYNGSAVYLVPLKVAYIKLQRYEAPGRALANYRIRYQLTTATSVGTSFTTTDWTLIWGPTTHTPVDGWNTYDVSDFYWTANNLRLDLSRDDTAYTSGGGMYRRTGLTPAKMCTYYSDSGRSWPFDGSCTQRDYAPAIIFGGLLRKYTDPEPTTSVGSEESTSPEIIITTYDENYVEEDLFEVGSKIIIRSNITIAGVSIDKALVSIIDNSSVVRVSNETMTLIYSNSYYLYEYNYTLPLFPRGTWTIIVYANSSTGLESTESKNIFVYRRYEENVSSLLSIYSNITSSLSLFNSEQVKTEYNISTSIHIETIKSIILSYFTRLFEQLSNILSLTIFHFTYKRVYPSIILFTEETTYGLNETVFVNGTIILSRNPLANVEIHLYEHNETYSNYLGSVYSDEHGKFNFTWRTLTKGNWTLEARYYVDVDDYTSANVTLNIIDPISYQIISPDWLYDRMLNEKNYYGSVLNIMSNRYIRKIEFDNTNQYLQPFYMKELYGAYHNCENLKPNEVCYAIYRYSNLPNGTINIDINYTIQYTKGGSYFSSVNTSMFVKFMIKNDSYMIIETPEFTLATPYVTGSSIGLDCYSCNSYTTDVYYLGWNLSTFSYTINTSDYYYALMEVILDTYPKYTYIGRRYGVAANVYLDDVLLSIDDDTKPRLVVCECGQFIDSTCGYLYKDVGGKMIYKIPPGYHTINISISEGLPDSTCRYSLPDIVVKVRFYLFNKTNFMEVVYNGTHNTTIGFSKYFDISNIYDIGYNSYLFMIYRPLRDTRKYSVKWSLNDETKTIYVMSSYYIIPTFTYSTPYRYTRFRSGTNVIDVYQITDCKHINDNPFTDCKGKVVNAYLYIPLNDYNIQLVSITDQYPENRKDIQGYVLWLGKNQTIFIKVKNNSPFDQEPTIDIYTPALYYSNTEHHKNISFSRRGKNNSCECFNSRY